MVSDLLNRRLRADTDSWRQNAELFTLTYGAIVTQLVKDCDNIVEVNEKLETM